MFSLAFVQSLSHAQLFVIPWTAGHQAFLSFTISWRLLKLMSIQSVMPSNHLILCCPFLPLPSVFPSIKVFSIDWFFTSGDQSTGASTSASVLPMNTRGWFPLRLTDLIVWFESPRDSQKPCPEPRFESNNSSALSLLYGPTLTSIHDYWKNHSFD